MHTSLTFVWINDNTLHTSLSSYHTYSRLQDCLDIVWRWKERRKELDSVILVSLLEHFGHERENVLNH